MKKFVIPITLLSLIAGSAQALQVDPVAIPHTIQYTIVIKENGQDEMRTVLTTIDGKEVVAMFTNRASYIKSTTEDEILQGSIETGYVFRLTPTITEDEAAISTHLAFEKQDLAHTEIAKANQPAKPEIHTTRIDNSFTLGDGETLTYPMEQDQQGLIFPTITRSDAAAPDSKRFISVTARKL